MFYDYQHKVHRSIGLTEIEQYYNEIDSWKPKQKKINNMLEIREILIQVCRKFYEEKNRKYL